jgi:hypothetical protein
MIQSLPLDQYKLMLVAHHAQKRNGYSSQCSLLIQTIRCSGVMHAFLADLCIVFRGFCHLLARA